MKTFIEHIKSCENFNKFQFAESIGYSLWKVLYNEDKSKKQYVFRLKNGCWWQLDSDMYLYMELEYLMSKKQ